MKKILGMLLSLIMVLSVVGCSPVDKWDKEAKKNWLKMTEDERLEFQNALCEEICNRISKNIGEDFEVTVDAEYVDSYEQSQISIDVHTNKDTDYYEKDTTVLDAFALCNEEGVILWDVTDNTKQTCITYRSDIFAKYGEKGLYTQEELIEKMEKILSKI